MDDHPVLKAGAIKYLIVFRNMVRFNHFFVQLSLTGLFFQVGGGGTTSSTNIFSDNTLTYIGSFNCIHLTTYITYLVPAMTIMIIINPSPTDGCGEGTWVNEGAASKHEANRDNLVSGNHQALLHWEPTRGREGLEAKRLWHKYKQRQCMQNDLTSKRAL